MNCARIDHNMASKSVHIHSIPYFTLGNTSSFHDLSANALFESFFQVFHRVLVMLLTKHQRNQFKNLLYYYYAPLPVKPPCTLSEILVKLYKNGIFHGKNFMRVQNLYWYRSLAYLWEVRGVRKRVFKNR